MQDSEFDIISEYFDLEPAGTAADATIALGIGDDCAVLSIPDGKQLVVTTDTLISGVHFPAHTSAGDIAYKSLMVNLSDIAAMGATARWITLAISLPAAAAGVDRAWLRAFSRQLATLLDDTGVRLIGGDTTRGALSVTIQAMGLVDRDRYMRRDQAKPGDYIYVTGYIGDAAIGLLVSQQPAADPWLAACLERLNRPVPRLEFASVLADHVRCAIDVSDGLLADLAHIADRSHVRAIVEVPLLPVSTAARYYFEQYRGGETDLELLLTGGDDYELCFTVHPSAAVAVEKLAAEHGVGLTRIGVIERGEGVCCQGDDGSELDIASAGYDHFNS